MTTPPDTLSNKRDSPDLPRSPPPATTRPCVTISPAMSTQARSPVNTDSKAGPPPGQYLGVDAVSPLLARIAPPSPESDAADSASLYLAPESLARWPQSRDASLRDWYRFVSPALNGPGGDALLKSDTGLVVLRHGEKGVALVPPFPVNQELVSEKWDEAPLNGLLTTDYTVGVVLLRLGRYLVAVFRGTEPLVTKTDTRYVKGKHHAGGTSQLRFKRIREGQMRKLFDEACGVVGSRFAPHERELDYILLGGEKLTLSGFLKVCPYLQRRQDIILDRRLNIRDPKHDTLETVSGLLRQSRVWPIGP